MAGEYDATTNDLSASAAPGSGDARVALRTHAVQRAPAGLRTPVALPRPTYWPVVMAAGIVFMTWGVATTLAISAVGLALFALALGGWIGDWRHGH